MSEFGKSGLGKLEYKTDEYEIKMEMPKAAPVYNTLTTPPATAGIAAAAPVPGAAAPQPAAAAPQPAAAAAGTPEPAAPAGAFIKSPLVGTYYAAPGEGSEPYVTAGSTVKKGETVCIVEAMKMMNEVAAPCDCVIEEVLKENATAAGFDEPLFRIREI